ncbi:hypothetical protein COHA_010574 [Chlorella ohadii]|uniref:Peptidase S54 rhomboid domain-containing protein n=1 Tax=Chlorella ohadii TaxID=2649997 RepID=A0AAD5DFT6_9CHLO|nr:hypothetical protein COHA_010574 [Chlorella ohadii]
MIPVGGSRALSRPLAALRPCLPRLAGGGGSGGSRRGSAFRGFLGASQGAAAAGLSLAAAGAGGLPSLAAAGFSGGGGGSGPQPGQFGHPDRRVTDVLLVANVLMFGLQALTNNLITAWGIKANALIHAGQWWRLITPAFLHGGLSHLLVNMYSLNSLGPVVETTVGQRRMLVMYFVSAVAGTVASLYGSPNLSLGASAAIFGMGGAIAVHFYTNRGIYGSRSDRVLSSLWQTLLINLVINGANPRIDHWGHMGGLAGGVLAAFLLGPRWKQTTMPKARGRWLVDDAPLPWLRSSPKPIDGGRLR